jgi:hypothetical protein
MTVRQFVKRSSLALPAVFLLRLRNVAGHQLRQLRKSWSWVVSSHEYTNFTYELTPENVVEMAWFVAQISGLGFDQSLEYIKELQDDEELRGYLRGAASKSPLRRIMDCEPHYGRRAAWYALVRALRPKHVVETGVDKGLGSCVFASALLRNAEEGYPGRLTALDINPDAGAPIGGKYASVTDLRFGDAIAILAGSSLAIDLFLHDSNHDYDHASAEYRTVEGLLTRNAIVMTDHGDLALSDFARTSGRRLLVFREDPAKHWSPGSVLGVAMPVEA